MSGDASQKTGSDTAITKENEAYCLPTIRWMASRSVNPPGCFSLNLLGIHLRRNAIIHQPS
jgi:hypothetical protein